jgi:hypothetical protein
MTNFAKIVVLAIVAFFALGLVIGLIKNVVGFLLSLVFPVAVLAGLGYIAWVMLGKKSLGGGGGRSLP